MKMHFPCRFLSAAVFTLTLPCLAMAPGQVEWVHGQTDRERAAGLIAAALSASEPVTAVAEAMVGTPYVAGTLDGDEVRGEMLRINLSEVDCTTFVDQVLAAVRAAGLRGANASVEDFEDALAGMRYRGGEIGGYASRLHYVSDWAVDLASRGLIEEVTPRLRGASKETKTLDFMTSHRAGYKALGDSAVFEQMRGVEAGYRNHGVWTVRASRVSRATLEGIRTGDIVALTTSVGGLDVSHLGIALKDGDGSVRLIHASSSRGEVVVDARPIAEQLRRTKGVTGIRVFRLR